VVVERVRDALNVRYDLTDVRLARVEHRREVEHQDRVGAKLVEGNQILRLDRSPLLRSQLEAVQDRDVAGPERHGRLAVDVHRVERLAETVQAHERAPDPMPDPFAAVMLLKSG